jgi:hypothetical protein
VREYEKAFTRWWIGDAILSFCWCNSNASEWSVSMSADVGTDRIDELMDQASHELARTRYFDAEKLAAEALQLARQADDFERMARIIMPLQEARRQRTLQALATKKVTVIDEEKDIPTKIKPGCYLFQPMLVGADARRLRLAALEAEVPVAVLAREPMTQLRLQPIVAISPGLTIRAKVDPPKNVDRPDIEWFARAMEELGDWAVSTIDPEMEVTRRIDTLLIRLDAHPEHEGLHQALRAACEEAAQQKPDPKAKKKSNGARSADSRAQAEL